MNVKFHKNCENTGKILKNSCVLMSFCEIGHFIFLGSHLKLSLMLLQVTGNNITSAALEKC